MLKNKRVIVGITGSVAAYKAPDLVREIKKEGVDVRSVITEAAGRFVTPLSLEIASEHPVFCNLFDPPFAHIDLVREADALLIAPATGNTISKMASGIADNLLLSLALAFNKIKIVAPAMNWRMYSNEIFTDKLQYLKSKGFIEVAPESGHLACGEEGIGRMAAVETIVDTLKKALHEKDLQGLKIIVTAGPTREFIDPVRFISNRSSGKMGFALAEAAYMRGADVILISGPNCLKSIKGIQYIGIETSEQMERAVNENLSQCNVIIMSAAVADFRCSNVSNVKVDKSDILSLNLVKNRDIIKNIAMKKKNMTIVGFSAETGRDIDRARGKMISKNLDMIVFNDVTQEGAGFDVDTNIVTIMTGDKEEHLPQMTKKEVAHAILDRVVALRR